MSAIIPHKAGFVNIIGKPNTGKSTLINALIGEKVSIVTPKVQTTRHRILGIHTEENYQIIFSDTPGIIDDPKYLLHSKMMKYVSSAINDADVILFMAEIGEPIQEVITYLTKLKENNVPILLCINKIDLSKSQEEVETALKTYYEFLGEENVIPISALKKFNIERIIVRAKELLPENPPYYEGDEYTDKSERFLVSELIREKIFKRFKQEIPYSVEVMVITFKTDERDMLNISAEIVVNRASQKPILIGKGGEGMKAVGTDVRKELEELYQKKVFIELFVKVKENWRENTNLLRQYGYDE
jgi:GTP-binding protein Era